MGSQSAGKRANNSSYFEQIPFQDRVRVGMLDKTRGTQRPGRMFQFPHLSTVHAGMVECRTEVEEKCEPNTSGYTTTIQCSKWPREVCRFNLNKEMLTNRNSMLRVSKKSVKKYTPITGCTKEPREICAPAGCGFKKVFDKKPFYFCFT